jgi:CRP-like cAMP-binding protein
VGVFPYMKPAMKTVRDEEPVRRIWNCTEAKHEIEQWKWKLRLSEPRRHRPGSELFVSGTSADPGFLIAQGIVALYYALPGGPETLFALAYPGELINLTALNPAQPTSSSGTALTSCEVYRIDFNRLDAAEQEDPEILKMLNRRLQAQVARRTKALVELKSLSPAERLERHLCELAEVLGCNMQGQRVRVPVPLSDGEMAMLLGLSNRQFKRVKKSLQENGRLTLENSRMFVLPQC